MPRVNTMLMERRNGREMKCTYCSESIDARYVTRFERADGGQLFLHMECASMLWLALGTVTSDDWLDRVTRGGGAAR